MEELLNLKKELLNYTRDKNIPCLVRELHVYELFKLQVKILRRSCGCKKRDEHISEQKITNTTNTDNTKNFAAKVSLLQEQIRNPKKGFVIFYKFSQLDEDFLLELLEA